MKNLHAFNDFLNEARKTTVKVKDLTMDLLMSIFNDRYKDIHFTREQPNGEDGNEML